MIRLWLPTLTPRSSEIHTVMASPRIAHEFELRRAMIEGMATVHMSEAEVARDLHAVLAKVQQGVG